MLQEKDFEQMSQDEIAQAKKAIQELVLMPNVRTRRYRSSGRGRQD